MTDVVQVAVTTESRDDADRIAAAVVEKRLAACAQVSGPITSHYRWQDKIENSQEWFVTMKTAEDRYEALEAEIVALHPYDTPEVLAVPVVAGSADYLKWVRDETRPSA